MKLNVTSEIGRLESVLIHLPGREIDDMMPAMMEELLFDDILFGQLAREEHRRFQQIVWFVAEEIHDLQKLLEETLEDEDGRAAVLEDLRTRATIPAQARQILVELPPRQLAEHLVGGMLNDDSSTYTLTPTPNLFFTRDPQVIVGDGVAISAMATAARARESLISWYVFRHHPGFRERDILWTPDLVGGSYAQRGATIEGGDVLVAREDILVVGLSERTNRPGIEWLAESLRNSSSAVKKIFVVELPSTRSYMHLDTVFTITNRNECIVFPPVILEGGDTRLSVYEMDLGASELGYSIRDNLLGSLAKEGLDLEPIPCGGKRRIDQDREQWTDGANAFALAPGVILLYERNRRTADELDLRGYEIVEEDDLLLGRVELDVTGNNKYAILVQGHELSRARGGPRCMTMPLSRKSI
ncbi:MAG: arginine deiminase [Acidobacteria bacterium]|nr:arginine deiminase [Acidobacteriota bacterium]